MWGTFFIAIVVLLLFIYGPGFLMLRAVRFSTLVSVVSAPLLSVPLYCLLAILYDIVGISCSWVALVGPVALAGACMLGISFLIERGQRTRAAGRSSQIDIFGEKLGKADWLNFLLYLVIGLIVALFVYAGSLDGSTSFVQDYDNVHHLGLTYSYLDSGVWSSVGSSLYPSIADKAMNPLPGTWFYPSAWNCLGALVSDSLGVSVPLAANVVNFVFSGLVLPASAFILLRYLFRNNKQIVPFGSVCVLAFASFPWGFFTFGPLYPNMVAFSLLPVVLFLFMSLFTPRINKYSRIAAGVLFCVGILCFAFSQPNAVFTAGVFLIPFCTYQVAFLVGNRVVPKRRKLLIKACACFVFLIMVAVLWFALYKAPFLQSVVTHVWPAVSTKSEAMYDVLSLSFRAPVAQLLLAVLVVVGVCYTLKKREHLWLSCSYLLAGFLYVVAAAAHIEGEVRYLFSGFWYTDSFRVAAFASIFAIPLAAAGLWAVAEGVRRIIEKIVPNARGRALSVGVSSAVAIVFCLLNYFPAYLNGDNPDRDTAFGVVTNTLKSQNSASLPQVLDANEAAFVEEVMEVIPRGALVLNEPNDGSVFAYGVDGMNVYYRYLRTYGDSNETEASKLIRLKLDKIDSDSRVRNAVKNLDARYLMILDQGEAQDVRPYPFTYEDGGDWVGIDAVRDTTPGFEVVLKSGDMRLYKIVDTK